MTAPPVELDDLLRARAGHFRLESGHHGQWWLELPALFLHPARVTPLAARLAARLRRHDVEVVCGPLIEGAFVALTVASELGVPFTYAEPQPPRPDAGGLFPVAYRVPSVLRPVVRGRRVAIVNDVVNAGSAVRGTLADLQACGATAVALASLLVLGEPAGRLARAHGLALETLGQRPNTIWSPAECPACASGVPLDGEVDSPA